MSIRNHVVITGTGRAGTSFLIELLTKLGLDTGFSEADLVKKKNSVGKAGLEYNLLSKDCPYIIKDPRFIEYGTRILEDESINIEHIYIPVRDIDEAADSRRRVTKIVRGRLSAKTRFLNFIFNRPENGAGGLWLTSSLRKGEQEKVLLEAMYNFLLECSKRQISISFINFPKLLKEPTFLYSKLNLIVGDIDYTDFLEVYNDTVQT